MQAVIVGAPCATESETFREDPLWSDFPHDNAG
jgi:hypothetical protein